MTTAPRPRGRPKGEPDTSATRARLIRAGLELLTEHGFAATGTAEVLARAGVPKGSFYHHFGSKAGFAAALIEAYDAWFRDRVLSAFRRTDLAPPDRIALFARAAEAGMARHGFRRGCLVGALGHEVSGLPDPLRARLSEVLSGWQAVTAATLDDLPGLPADAGALAALFWTGWEGAVLRARMDRSPEPLRAFAATFLTLIDHPRGEPPCSTPS